MSRDHGLCRVEHQRGIISQQGHETVRRMYAELERREPSLKALGREPRNPLVRVTFCGGSEGRRVRRLLPFFVSPPDLRGHERRCATADSAIPKENTR